MKITKEQIDRAKKLYPFKDLKGSITKGESNIFGALGEVIIHDINKANGNNVDFNSTYDYDLIINGFKVDVKTKKTTVKPKGNYLCSISSFNTKQKCDYYFFVRITEDLKECYILGYKRKADFFKEATFNKKGEIDPEGNGVWTFKDDCYNLKIKMLNQFK